LLATLDHGGDGYCLHATMLSRPDTAAMLNDIKRIAALGHSARATAVSTDIVHFDFSYANILALGSSVTAVIDWNVPFAGASQGDRGFDVATLLFYAYDRDAARQLLWPALLERTTEPWAAIFLAHLALRQVEWVVRFYPGSEEERRFLAIGGAVLDDALRLIT
jgi:aminoglycoside phosphotransferase (APT) family kinase protein